MLNFIKSFVSFFPISRRDTHVGVILYTRRAIPIFRFNKYYTRAAILRAIENLRYPRGGTYIGKALSFARRYLYPGRPASNRKRVTVVLTDGISQDRVSGPARHLRVAGCEIFVLGIGRGYRISQLRQIATDNNHIFTASFRSLGKVMQKIKSKACQKPVPTPSKHCSCKDQYFQLKKVYVQFNFLTCLHTKIQVIPSLKLILCPYNVKDKVIIEPYLI